MALAESPFICTVHLSYSQYWPDLSKIWKWLDEHVGKFALDWSWFMTEDIMTYCFKSPAAAAEFTLAWL